MSTTEQELVYHDGPTTLRGLLVRPAPRGGAPRPGVLVVHEWWGLNDHAKRRARQLAEGGLVALAVDMYGGGLETGRADEAAALAARHRTGEAARTRIACALQALRRQPDVDPGRIAAVGFCFGGSVVLELARSGADLRSVTCFHGSLATPMPAIRGTLKAAVLVLHGADDDFISPQEIAIFQDEMRSAGADWQWLSLGGARHSFSNPDADAAGIDGVAFHAASERRAWRLFESFLGETLALDAAAR